MELTSIGTICVRRRKPRQIVRAVCRRFRHFRDKVYNCGVCDEGILGRMDIADQVDRTTAGHCIWSVRGERGSECALRCVYGERDIAVLQQIQAERIQDEGGLDGNSSGRSGSCIWQSHWWGALFSRGMDSRADMKALTD